MNKGARVLILIRFWDEEEEKDKQAKEGSMGKRQSWILKITFFFFLLSPPLANLVLLFLSLKAPPFPLPVAERGAVLDSEVQFNSQQDKKENHKYTHLGWVHLLWYAKGYLIIAGQCFSESPRGWLCVCVCVREEDSWHCTTQIYTQVCLFSSFVSRGFLAVCMWPL